MSYLFAIVHITFAGIFYGLFHDIIGAVAFVLAGAGFFVYFHPSLNFNGEGEGGLRIRKEDILVHASSFLQRQTYFIAFASFYLSLFGISYSFKQNYPLLTFSLSTIVAIIYIVMYSKKTPLVFLLFRSNFITFTGVHTAFITYMLIGDTAVEHLTFFIVNSIYSLIGLIAIVAFDTTIDRLARRHTYTLALLYALGLGVFLLHILTPLTPTVLLSMLGLAYGMLLSSFARYIPRLSAESDVAENIGRSIIQMASILVVGRFLSGEMSADVLILLALALLSNIWLYRRDESIGSLAITVIVAIAGYAQLVGPATVGSIVSALLFTYTLPGIMIGLTYLLPLSRMKDLYILHSAAISFVVVAYLTYIIRYPQVYRSTLVASLFLLPFSLVLFFTYVRYQQK